MIPRMLHYCWFGGAPHPKAMATYLAGWRRACPGYAIREWNETNFDLDCCAYVRQAYDQRKFAFVSDYARGLALLTQGGIYLDTDVELLGSFDAYLHHRAFFGFEHGWYVATSTMGAQSGQEIFQVYLEQYHRRAFQEASGKLDLTTNVQVLTALLEARGLRRDGATQHLPDGITCYPQAYFSPYDYANHLDHRTKETVAIHHYAQTWLTPMGQLRRMLKRWVLALGGRNLLSKLRREGNS